MYCYNCGKKLDENVDICPECGATLGKGPEPKEPEVKEVTPKKKPNLPPRTAVGLIFSALSLIFGFILVTSALATGRGIAYVEYIGVVPALVGLGICAHNIFDSKTEKEVKNYSIIGAGVSLFVLLYAFIGFMVFIAG